MSLHPFYHRRERKVKSFESTGTATAFTFEEKRKKGQKEYQEKVRVREQP